MTFNKQQPPLEPIHITFLTFQWHNAVYQHCSCMYVFHNSHETHTYLLRAPRMALTPHIGCLSSPTRKVVSHSSGMLARNWRSWAKLSLFSNLGQRRWKREREKHITIISNYFLQKHFNNILSNEGSLKWGHLGHFTSSPQINSANQGHLFYTIAILKMKCVFTRAN